MQPPARRSGRERRSSTANHFSVFWSSDKAAGILDAQRLIIAAGAYDRPMPFPGWTLPGVMTAGGVQVLIKTMAVRPGCRALVAGTGLLPLGVAKRLHNIGVEVTGVLEAGNPFWLSHGFPEPWMQWEVIQDATDALSTLRNADTPVLGNHTIFAAIGTEAVEAASYGPVQPHDWQPIKNRGQTVEVDLVVLGFGFVPNTELTVLAGCRHEYVHALGGWIPSRDPLMQTTVPGIFAVGDGAGIRGPLIAETEGRIAGIAAAEQLGAISETEGHTRRHELIARLESLTTIRAALDEVSEIRPGLLELATNETLLCRCEEISRLEVESAIEEGARDLQAVKLLTRLGMGPCQGRNCAPSTGMHLCQRTGRMPEEVGRINPRPPAGAVRAVPFLEKVRVKRTWAGLRPGSPDELPILGPVEPLKGYLNACGHFRTGILTAPLTGLLIAELASGEPLSFLVEPFLLSRFGPDESTVGAE